MTAIFDLFHEIGQTISNNKLRTFLTGLAVAWGIFMLIVLLGAARGVVNSFEKDADDSSNKSIEISGGYTSLPYKGYRDGRSVKLKEGDISTVLETGNVDGVNVTARASGLTITGPKNVLRDGFKAVYPEEKGLSDINMKSGRFINGRDISELRRTVVMHEDNAKLLFENPEDAIGKEVSALGLSWLVVGIYTHRWEKSTYVPYTTYKTITGSDGNVETITATVAGLRTEEDGKQAEKDIKEALARNHEFNPTDKSALHLWNKFTQHVRMGQGLSYLNIAVWVIGIFTLLSGIIGVSNIMFVSVKERVHEIGIRRAIGAKPRSVIIQIISESVAITAIFGYAGLVAGMLVLQLIDHLVGEARGFSNPTVDLSMAFQVTVALIMAGTLAGLFPAIKATKVKPVEALRDE